MVVTLLTHICVNRLHWVNIIHKKFKKKYIVCTFDVMYYTRPIQLQKSLIDLIRHLANYIIGYLLQRRCMQAVNRDQPGMSDCYSMSSTIHKTCYLLWSVRYQGKHPISNSSNMHKETVQSLVKYHRFSLSSYVKQPTVVNYLHKQNFIRLNSTMFRFAMRTNRLLILPPRVWHLIPNICLPGVYLGALTTDKQNGVYISTSRLIRPRYAMSCMTMDSYFHGLSYSSLGKVRVISTPLHLFTVIPRAYGKRQSDIALDWHPLK